MKLVNFIAAAFLAGTLLIVLTGIAAYIGHPTPELADALAGVLGALGLCALSVLGIVLIGTTGRRGK